MSCDAHGLTPRVANSVRESRVGRKPSSTKACPASSGSGKLHFFRRRDHFDKICDVCLRTTERGLRCRTSERLPVPLSCVSKANGKHLRGCSILPAQGC